jgi:hypothetical protein
MQRALAIRNGEVKYDPAGMLGNSPEAPTTGDFLVTSAAIVNPGGVLSD